MGQLYLITVTSTGKSYVGISTVSADHRWKQHIYPSTDTFLARAIRKYGIENTVRVILAESDSWEELCKLEREHIVSRKTRSPSGYNLTDGGEGALGHVLTSDARAKISAANKKRFGSPELRAKASANTKRQMASPEARANLAAKCKQRMSSPEALANLSEKGKTRYADPTYLANASANTKRQMSSVAMRANLAEKGKIRYADPAARAHLAAKAKVRITPEFRAKLAKKAKQRMSDPIVRIQNLAQLALVHAKRAGRTFSYINL